MTALLTIFVSSFVIALSGAMMPGPLLTATISESSTRGITAGPLLILGHGILELALVIAIIAGLAPFFQSTWLFTVIAFAGSVILLWMAVNMFRSLPNLSLSKSSMGSAGNRLVINGVLLSISNPYWTLWWATIGLGYILQSQHYGLWGIVFFFSGHILADLAWYTVVSVGFGRGRQFLNDHVYRAVIGICAALLVVFAGYFLYVGLVKIVT
jgi:threonine/homoserine/homoserine lactone efflux protein